MATSIVKEPRQEVKGKNGTKKDRSWKKKKGGKANEEFIEPWPWAFIVSAHRLGIKLHSFERLSRLPLFLGEQHMVTATR